MRNSIRLAAALAALSFGSTAYAADTESATASAEILSTISVTKDQDMSFGQIAVNGNGTYVLNPDGSHTCTASLICTGTRSAAEFTVSGTTTTAVSASVTETSINLVHATDATKSFVLSNFSVNFPDGNTLASTGRQFNVGGSLNVQAANAVAGVYQGTFNVSVEYM